MSVQLELRRTASIISQSAGREAYAPFRMPADAIRGFDGNHRFLSNFFHSPVSLSGTIYPTVEHAFQAAKTLDPTARLKVRSARSPADAKRLGRSVRLRSDWEDIKVAVMLGLCRQKFVDPELRALLAATADQPIYEVTTRWNDKVWGVVALPNGDFLGGNRLGRVLMRVRSELP